jgi:hypothetical protein
MRPLKGLHRNDNDEAINFSNVIPAGAVQRISSAIKGSQPFRQLLDNSGHRSARPND